jgi:hypothetical protein
MDIINLFTGVLMIALGFLVKIFPNLIAGYNTMSAKDKANVDIEGLSTYMRNGLILIGVSIIVGYFFFKWLGLDTIAIVIMPIVSVIGAFIIVFKAQKFNYNKRGK